MTTIQRVRVLWTGFPGAPGISTFYFTDHSLQRASFGTFLEGVANSLPTDVLLTVPQTGDEIEAETGQLTGAWTAASVLAPIPGTASGAYSAPSGFLINWNTETVIGGRRLRGRTFCVPATQAIYQSDGSITAAVVTGYAADAQTLLDVSSGNMLVWRRPREARVAYTDGQGRPHAAVAARAGAVAGITSATVPDMAAVLRSRRD